MKNFSIKQREKNLQQVHKQFFDLVIVGGGINGAGVAREAASRGMKVCLLEIDDFASGTSSRSSKLIHGGIRYLENLEFGLVFEALSERARLFDMAPHLVHPLRFVLPIYKGARVGMLKMGLGMMLYDVLSSFEAPELHERLGKTEVNERLPLLDQNNLKGAYVYSDAYMDDDRLTIESLRSASHLGACVLNYVGVDALSWEKDSVIVTAKDQKSGANIKIQAKHLVCGLGPWTDIFGQKNFPHWKRCLRPTKGVHLTVARERVKLNEAVVMVSEDQKRIIFGIPRHDMTIFGTTDQDYSGDPREVSTTSEDVKYLLKHINLYFPGAKLREEDIIASYAGVRPLVADGSSSEGKTSREHEIWQENSSTTVVAGGKYTTYRLIAEQVVERVLNNFSIEDQAKFSHSKSHHPINPAINFSTMNMAFSQKEQWAQNFGFSVEQVQRLIERHGVEALELLSRKELEEDASEELLWVLEARHAIENSMCMGLRDFYFRRSPLFLAVPGHGLQYLEAISKEFQRAHSWDTDELEKQKTQLHQQIQHDMAWRK